MCVCLEEEEPEIFLAPRNFNPHPYQSGYNAQTRRNGNQGPVVFPATGSGGTNGKTASVQGKIALDVDNHPYASVVKRKRYKQAGRFDGQVMYLINVFFYSYFNPAFDRSMLLGVVSTRGGIEYLNWKIMSLTF